MKVSREGVKGEGEGRGKGEGRGTGKSCKFCYGTCVLALECLLMLVHI